MQNRYYSRETATRESIVEQDTVGARAQVVLKKEVALEFIRFVGLSPLAMANFRAEFDDQVI